MKTFSYLLTVILLVTAFSTADDALAQMRDARTSPLDWTGNVVKDPAAENSNKLFGLVNFQMNHSYEMTMTSAGGQTFNQNFYTNTMHLMFNERLTGRLDVSMAHSMFGNMPGFDNGPRVFVRNAELNYKFSENSRLHVSFSQMPYGYGYNNMYNRNFMNPYYSPYGRSNRYHYDPFGF
ncbi:MAG: hypothetical protein ACNA8K_15865 [Cyclonatronaceae bacterium]